MWQTTTLRTTIRHDGGFICCARMFTYAALIGLASATAAFAQADVMIADCAGDAGNEPNTACGNTYHNSPSIWIRRNADNGTVHQHPQGGQTVHIYVKLKNIGPDMLEEGVVYVYYGAKSTSLSSWPTRWENDPPNGDLIGTAPVYNLGSGATETVRVEWPTVPTNSNGDHYCLLARFISSECSAPVEGKEVYDNTVNNKSIAWRNLTPIYPPPMGNPPVWGGTIAFYNDRDYPVTTELKFDSDLPGMGLPLPDNIQFKVILGPMLYQRWFDGTKIGLSAGITDDPTNHTIYITSLHESIGGILLGPNEEFDVSIEVIYSDGGLGSPDVHKWDITQYEAGRPEPIGGVSFDVHMKGEEAGKRVVQPNDKLDMELDLSAQPNLGSSEMTLGFNLNSDDRITLAIYDLNGRLVRTLLSESPLSAGRHEVVWDGQSDAGVPVPVGTYLYSLNVRDGVARKQLKVVR